MKYFILISSILIFAISCSDMTSEQADLIITNAVIWTGDEELPEASALAVNGDRILFVGSDEEVGQYAAEGAEQIDAGGQMIVPGFIDCHVHFLSGGFGLSSVQLRDAATPEEFSDRIRAFAETVPEGTWITEGNWDHELWGGELPKKEWIDRYTPNHPVFVSRLDGHMALANTAAMQAVGLTGDVEDIDGGTIVRYENGDPTGIFKDNAMGLISSKIPEPSDAQEDRAIRAAMDFVASHGVTSIHNMDQIGVESLEVYERTWRSGDQITRFYIAMALPYWRDLQQVVEQEGTGDEWYKIGVLKGMADGSLGSHTAAFFEPFTDTREDTGLWVTSPNDMYEYTSGADQAGLHVVIHAIGDKANRTVLNIFERVQRENGPRDRRFRIEHAQHLAPEDIDRFAGLDVIPSMQPYHAIDDGRWAEKVIGPDRIKRTYAFRSLLDTGAPLAFGSDWSVAPPTPLEGIYAAVTRRTIDGAYPGGWVPDQKITVEEALRAYTVDAAYSSFDEDKLGKLRQGMLADFVILEKDIRVIPPDEIRDIKVVRTVVGGKTVYEAR